MYIEKYWGEYIGGTDDSLTLTAYLEEKHTPAITVHEIFRDFGRDTIYGDFRNTVPALVYTNPEGWEMDVHFAIDLVSDLAALLLECQVHGGVDLLELDDTLELPASESRITITASSEDLKQINGILSDFSQNPLAYDISAFVPEEDLHEMAVVFEEIRKELCAQGA